MKRERVHKLAMALAAVLVTLLMLADAQAQTPISRDAVSLSSGDTGRFDNVIGSGLTRFEYNITGGPASASIVLKGCMRGGTCDTLQTDTTTADTTRLISGLWDYFTIAPTFTGGTSPKAAVKMTSIARSPMGDTLGVVASGAIKQVQGAAADGATAVGNPVQTGGVDGSGNAQAWLSDVNGRQANSVGYGVSVLADGLTNNVVNPYCGGSGGCQANGTNNGVGWLVEGLLFNGSTWDKPREVLNGQNTTGTGVAATGSLCQLDDTSTGAVTENQFSPCRQDSARVTRVDTEGQKLTYGAAAINFTPAATPTDVCVLPGSASKTIRITRVMAQGFATTKGSMTLQLVKRAAADTAGTSAGLTAVPYDSADAAASAAPLKYTANPTINSTVGIYDTKSLNFAVAGDESTPYIFDTSYRGGAKALVLRGVAEQVALNLNGGAVPTGGTIGCSFEWTEE
jgi:hypothetical protein